MKITFPYMGPVLAYKKLMESVGHEVIMPQKPTQRTIDLGAKYSPEFLCFPFKCIMGTYLEAIERGAEAIVTSGGDSSCRAGFYAEVHRQILENMGYNVQFFVFDSMFLHPKEFYCQLNVLRNGRSWYYLFKKFRTYYSMVGAMDRLEEKIRILRAHEQHCGDFARTWAQIHTMFDQCDTIRDVRQTEQRAWDMLHAVPLKEYDPSATLKVGLVGEIYVTMEGHANLEVEESLAKMGVEVVNSQYVSHWLGQRIRRLPWQKSDHEQLLSRAVKYLKMDLGGHDQENIAHMIEFWHKGIDGIIHLRPFACLPELVTESIIPRVSSDLGIPILTLACDEQRGTANSQTRLEAFVDLMRIQKNQPASLQQGA